ncbi:hypothetical protein [Clostridium formicaceticum]|uniref:Uncharacterized protein n=1 Tax=Clostridium formicaceticum TaxID=1497 RepID=A0AAC9WG16_9CLOT|nr:hypothetical protein [Clostridium formicaceticum]AOY76866.1 hypothetical protein BJL90_14005 [Clostridium formicaceticum]ARE87346.1 hypothetical protein CLFO_17450 [Clostridium formicaceticum]
MNCIHCENCKLSTKTYYCFAKNDFVIPTESTTIEKVRTGWKKGEKEYETHRRKTRKEVEI